MMKQKHWLLAIVCLWATALTYADEGMWMLGDLNKETRRTMKELGLELTQATLQSRAFLVEGRRGQLWRVLFGGGGQP